MSQVFEREGVEFGRGLSFFDAIFAFAITVLVVNIEPPPAKDWQNLATLMDGGLGNQLTCFAISFVVIAVFWRHNTQLMRRFRGMDSVALSANILTAGFVVLIPFSTQALSDPEIYGNPLPTAVYAVNVTLAILSQMLTLEIGRARGLLVDDIPRAAWWAGRIDVLIKAAVFLASIPVAYLFGARWGQLSWLLLIVAGRVSGRWSDRVADRARVSSPE
ncbi:DUF1211 domain-containing protein [Leucobacter viscericola]|uniref:DUF1211 domain-containing protein n=1 Tax=Leucobacter viscericola TaxID=2714935 RepID=A0A6G7XGM0_9MICO|nr:TMEM175 family protein [Leucobacter viscericola]QIK63652.1 DUF1211 domain-containing protein [Leucobacter viscericola]